MSRKPIFDVSSGVKNAVKEELSKLNHTLDFIVRASNHSADRYLYYVIAHKSREVSGSSYVLWLWNDSTKALQTGQYGLTDGVALQLLAKNLFLVENK